MKSLNRMKLGSRLAAGFGLVLALVACIAAMGWWRMERTHTDVASMAALRAAAGGAQQWSTLTQLNINRTLAIAKSGGHDDVTAYFEPRIKETSAQITALQKSLEAGIASAEEKRLFADIAERRKQYVEIRKNIFALLDIGDEGAKRALEENMLPASEAYLAAIRRFEELRLRQAHDGEAAMGRDVGQAQAVMVALSLLCLAVGAALAVVITRSVTRPLREMARITQRIASGDLSTAVPVEGRDEVTDVLAGLERMRVALGEVVSHVRSSTDSITTASSEVAAGSQDLSCRTEQAAASLQQTASSMEQISSTVKHTADAARTANQMASAAASAAGKGSDAVARMVGTMQSISGRSREIVDIIALIDSIAFQTNILALNAAVEASRAGEQGRGFAVVAGEVRSLAHRSAEAARQIKALINSSNTEVESGASMAADAHQAMLEIVASVNRVSDVIGEISAASAEQSDGIGQVNTAVSQLDQMTQQNAALVEQSAAAADSLRDQASQLARTVAVFMVDRRGEPAMA